jgi:purine-binding chemotaxis protein CheW
MAEPIALLVFELAGGRYALRMDQVREVVAAVFITPLPSAPPVVEGVVDVRGATVPVYDLRYRFRLPAVRLHPAERMVVAWSGERQVAFRCDAVEWLETVPTESVEEPDRLTSGNGLIIGVARLEDGIVLIHDLPAFLDDAERQALDAALADAAAG